MEPQPPNNLNPSTPQARPTPANPPINPVGPATPNSAGPTAPVTPSPVAPVSPTILSPISPTTPNPATQPTPITSANPVASATPTPTPTPAPVPNDPFATQSKPKTKKSTLIALVIVLILCAAAVIVAILFSTGVIDFGNSISNDPPANPIAAPDSNQNSQSTTNDQQTTNDSDSTTTPDSSTQDEVSLGVIDKIVTDFTNYKNRKGGALPPITATDGDYQYVTGDELNELDDFFTIYVKSTDNQGNSFTLRVFPSANLDYALGNGGNIFNVFYQSTCTDDVLTPSDNPTDFAVTYQKFDRSGYLCRSSNGS